MTVHVILTKKSGAETKTSHEASYIPFMLSTGSSSAEAGSARPRGRRTFNAKGSEVKEEPVSLIYRDLISIQLFYARARSKLVTRFRPRKPKIPRPSD